MGFDMRVPNGRCPSFLVASCILLYIILLCNWWSLSSQNFDLTNQINILEEQMKICCGERDTCTNNKNKLEIAIGDLKVNGDHEKTNYEVALKKKENILSICKTELESLKIIDASKTQSLDALRATLDEKKEKIARLNEQLNSITTDEAPKNSKEKMPKGNEKNEAVESTTEPAEIRDGERDQEMANNTK